MNNESPTGNADADAPVPLAGTEQALSDALDQATKNPKPEESSTTERIGDALASDLISDAFDVVMSIFDD
jgi:hypothetical protein